MRIKRTLGVVAAMTLSAGASGLVASAADADSPSTLYVNNTTVCSDTGPGTVVDPFCSISAAVDVVTAGQTIAVTAGSYPEHVTISASGSATAPITLAGSGIVTLTGPTGGVTVSGQSYISVSGIHIAGETTATGIALSEDAHLTLTNDQVIGVSGNVPSISLSGVRDSTFQALTVSSAGGPGIVADAASTGLTFTTPSVTRSSGQTTGAGADGYDIAASNSTFTRPIAADRTGSGFDITGSGDTLNNPYAELNDGAGIVVGTGASGVAVSNALVEGNLDGIDINGGSGTSFVNGRVQTNHGAGIVVSGGDGAALASDTVANNCGGITVAGAATNTSVQDQVITEENAPSGCSTSSAAGVAITGAATNSVTENYNTVYATLGSPYVWQTADATLAAFQAASGQGAQDQVGAACLCGPAYTDSANSAAPAFPTFDVNGKPREDDPTIANTGSGPIAYADRGATELIGYPQVTVGVSEVWPGFTDTVTVSTQSWYPITSYTFNFGDGTPAVTQANPMITHTFQEPGAYAIDVSATDTENMPGTGSHEVATGGSYTPVPLARILNPTTIAAKRSHQVQVAGFDGVPSTDLVAVLLNIDATAASAAGSLTTYADGQPRPAVANLHFPKSATVQNLITVPVVDGKIDIYNGATSGSVETYADIQGYYQSTPDPNVGIGSAYSAMNPERVLDTATGVGTTKVQVKAHGTLSIPVATLAPVNAVPQAIALNVQATHQTNSSGHLVIYNASNGIDGTSNLHWTSKSTVSNLVVVQTRSGLIDFYNDSDGAVDIIADLQGYFSSVGGYLVPLTPTRAAEQTVAGGKSFLTTLSTLPTPGLHAVVLNVTVTKTTASGHASVSQTGAHNLGTSHLHWASGQTYSEMVIVPVAGGLPQVTFANGSTGSAEVLVDVVGYFAGSVDE